MDYVSSLAVRVVESKGILPFRWVSRYKCSSFDHVEIGCGPA